MTGHNIFYFGTKGLYFPLPRLPQQVLDLNLGFRNKKTFIVLSLLGQRMHSNCFSQPNIWPAHTVIPDVQ